MSQWYPPTLTPITPVTWITEYQFTYSQLIAMISYWITKNNSYYKVFTVLLWIPIFILWLLLLFGSLISIIIIITHYHRQFHNQGHEQTIRSSRIRIVFFLCLSCSMSQHAFSVITLIWCSLTMLIALCFTSCHANTHFNPRASYPFFFFFAFPHFLFM